MNLSTIQVDYTSAFLYAKLNDEVYVDIPKVLTLKRSLYGLRQSPRNVFLDKLENLEFIQSEIDPCLSSAPIWYVSFIIISSPC